MKKSFLVLTLLGALCSAITLTSADANKTPALDVLKMSEIPSGTYDVHLQHEGKDAKVKLKVAGNRAEFVESTSSKLEGLSGNFDPIGNGVFLARLSCRNGGASQFWIFKPDGTASIKEIPDRGEKQIAKLISKD
jgi:hypothetical protein